jgi:hypothetical protein
MKENRDKYLEKILGLPLPNDYRNFIKSEGYKVLGDYEIFGYIEGMDIEQIPCVIGATKLYKQDYDKIEDNDLVISFDPFYNNPIVLNTQNGKIYRISNDKRILVARNFNEWLNSIKNKLE